MSKLSCVCSACLSFAQIEAYKKVIFQSHRSLFFFWIMNACHSVSRKSCTMQLFYISLVCDFRGLSIAGEFSTFLSRPDSSCVRSLISLYCIAGRSLLAKANQLTPAETYRRYKKRVAAAMLEQLDELRCKCNTVDWWDNYAHNLASARISIKRGSWKFAAYTGMAIFTPEPHSPPSDLSRLYDEDGRVVLCMPSLSTDISGEIVLMVINKLDSIDRIEFDDYYITQKNIFTAPLKPQSAENEVFPSLAGFHSYDICEDYIGSSHGLHRIIKRHCEKVNSPEFGDRYSMVMLDVSPFTSIMRVGDLCFILWF